MNFSGVDLNLLRIFDALMQERSTTKVAERVGLSQPAVSSALARLRHLANDDLFIREGGRMVPTSKAEAMREPVRAVIAGIEGAFAVAAPFDPATSDRSFRLLGSDYFSTLLMPSLSARALRAAPRIILQMIDMPSSEVASALANGLVDAALSPSTIDPPDYVACRTLFCSWVVTLVARDHPLIAQHGCRRGQRLTPELFCRYPQVVMSMDGSTRGTIDGPLEAQGFSRRVALTLPHFHAVALAIATGGVIGSLPVHYASQVAVQLDLEVLLPPFDAPILDVRLYWHRRHDLDAANTWLRGLIAEAAALGEETDLMDDALRKAVAATQATSDQMP
jgi:DNA-binding transcriptional LysR family regulator